MFWNNYSYGLAKSDDSSKELSAFVALKQTYPTFRGSALIELLADLY